VTVRVQCGVCRQTLDWIESDMGRLSLRGSAWWVDPVPGPERPRIGAIDMGGLSDLPPRLTFVCPRHGSLHLTREVVEKALATRRSVVLATNVLL
jgi:hypothetical protein